ncbi:MAG: GNAT family N-acetyltransferase [Gammaproteobacteria bacterium]|nr:GNAT family N-acetyltransferase [Gammaproteobacteria bacterium]
MDFQIDTADVLAVSDPELSELLSQVYVDGDFVTPEMAVSLVDPAAVRSRGKIIAARKQQSLQLAGMVIVVYPDSPARRLAQGDETEMHLLGVKSEYRGKGLGRALVAAAIHDAKQCGYSKMILWTQPTMHAAHRLYEISGFVRAPGRDFIRAGRDFKVYEKEF